jgi:hypothetical protein
MPDVLWPLFRDNPHLTAGPSPLAANIIQSRVSMRSGLRVGVMTILHTFNGKLAFNSHVHTMVTAGGLNSLSDSWVPTVYYERDKLLESWRKAVIKLLRTALRIGQLVSSLTVDEIVPSAPVPIWRKRHSMFVELRVGRIGQNSARHADNAQECAGSSVQ